MNPSSCCVMLMAVRIWREHHESVAQSWWGMFSWHTLGNLIEIEQHFHAPNNSGCSGAKVGSNQY